MSAEVIQPSVGLVVHYVSHGTPGGEYGKECRAAIVTETDTSDTVGLAVLNPTGMLFDRTVVHHEADPKLADANPAVNHPGGTWHWPERV
jgi:hypothetical protein